MTKVRRRTGMPMVIAAALVVGGCSLFADDTDDRDTAALADDVAAALSSGDLSAADWDSDAAAVQERWDAIVAGLGDDTTVSVSAGAVALNDDDTTASVPLSVTWDLGGHQWSYETTADLVKAEDQWQARFTPALVEPSLADGEILTVVTTDAARADVVGAGDAALVTSRPVIRIGIDKAHIDAAEAETSARDLAEAVEIDVDGFVERVGAAGEKAFVEAITLRDSDVSAGTLAAIESIPGAHGIADEMHLAPTREFARPLLGTVGPATAEIIEASGGAIDQGDVVGLSGLQQRYDESLRGTAGITVRAVLPAEAADEDEGDAAGSEDDTGGADGAEGEDAGGEDAGGEDQERDLFTAEPIDGIPLTVSLDETVQLRAEEILATAGSTAALVAVRPSDGHVLAAAGTSPDGYSIATLGQYAPGSTFKVVSALALVRAGMDPSSAMSCPPTFSVEGYTFTNYDDYPSAALGDIDLRTAIAESCNTAMIQARDSAPPEALAEAAASLGLGVDRDLGFPAYFGAVPTTADGTAHAAAMIGQGEVLASPLAMATVAASVAAGQTVSPVLVVDGGDAGAAPDATAAPDEATTTAPDEASTSEPPADAAPEAAAVPLTGEEAEALYDLMRAAVTDGSASFLSDVPGDPVIAKTGTAEYGTGDDLETHAWMIAAQGDLAVAVFVETGESGSSTAGPLLEEFLRAVNS